MVNPGPSGPYRPMSMHRDRTWEGDSPGASPETSAHARRLTCTIQADSRLLAEPPGPQGDSRWGQRTCQHPGSQGEPSQHHRVEEDSSSTQASVPSGHHSVPVSHIAVDLVNQTFLEARPDHTRKNPARDPGTMPSDHRHWSCLRTKRTARRYQAFLGRFGVSGRGTTSLKRCHTSERDGIGGNLRILPGLMSEKTPEETTPSRQQ